MLIPLSVTALAVSLSYSASAAATCIKRQASDLNEAYDFIIAGGGTAGLTVADRLSAAFPNRSVLVVEVGKAAIGQPQYEPPGVQTMDLDAIFIIDPLPSPGLNNRTAGSLLLGKAVGGSSAVNGQLFDRASRHDYDMLANYSEASDWNWEGLKPYFKKSVTFVEPGTEEVKQYGYTWDMEAYGGSTPIISSFPPFQWPTSEISRQAWVEIGLEAKKECAGGDKAGLCWIPLSQNPVNATRSHSGIGHYELISSRPNLHVLMNYQVTRAIYSGKDKANEVPVVEIKSVDDSSIHNITARAEVIISTGAVHTPQVLQRSGLGPAPLLKEAGINVVLEIPGVGYNFQDNSAVQFSIDVTKDLHPNDNDLNSNETYQKECTDQYALRPAQGPYTQGVANTAAFAALSMVTDQYKAIAAAVREQITTRSAAQYLPPGTPETVAAGYYAQLEHLADAMENGDQPFLEAWTNGVPFYGILLHPLSRGSILLNPSDMYGEPIVNSNTANNPVDIDILSSFVPFFRKLWAADAYKDLGIVEVSPGANVTDAADLRNWLIGESIQGDGHQACCTASMAPLDKGGVVGSDLRVHGLNKLRVADLSVTPLLVGAHLQATAYAIGEKAADLIIADWS